MNNIDKPPKRFFSNPRKRRAWCIYQLAIKGSSVAAVARSNGMSRQAMYHVFLNPYPRMEKMLANALGMQPQELFPERYDADGLPNRRIGRPPLKSTVKSICKRSACNGNLQGVA